MIKFKVMENSKIRTALLCFYLFFPIFALANNTADAITMVSYEQRWLDSRGTLALKNNTNEEIHNVSFQITYLDMSGNPLDYEEFTKSISIAPGMTKKIDIPAYEHDRNYHYYKSENMPGGSPSFKIKFNLKGYNRDLQETDADDYGIYDNDDDESYYSSNKSDSIYIIIVISVVLFVIGLSVGLYVLVAVMAKSRNRSVVLWVLLSIIASPLLIIIILLVVGEDNKRIDDYDMP